MEKGNAGMIVVIVLGIIGISLIIVQMNVSINWEARAKIAEKALSDYEIEQIDQKYEKKYNTLDYEVNLPDAMTVAIEVNYSKNHILSPVQEYELVRIHKEAIAEITLEEWTKYKGFGTSYDLSEMELVQPELEDWSKSFE